VLLPVARIRVRTGMLVIAVAAVLMYGQTVHQRSLRYHRLSKLHAKAANSIIKSSNCPPPEYQDGLMTRPEWFDHLRASLDYHRRLAIKYERASSRPWLAVRSDPPEPKLRAP
jgi:hypothetical protein